MPCSNTDLSDAQKEVMEKIVNIGRELGMSDSEIELAVQVAFQESSLGQNITNPNSSAYGLFQYTTGTWSDRHSDLERDNIDHQVIAYYRDIVDLQGRYNEGRSNGDIPSNLSFGEYAYIRHHDGWSYSNLEGAPGGDIFEGFSDFCIDQVPPPAEDGGGGSSWTDPSTFDGGNDYSWLIDWFNNQDDPNPKPIIEVGEPITVSAASLEPTSSSSEWMLCP